MNLNHAVGGSIGKKIGIGTIINNDYPDIDITEIEQLPVIIDPKPIIPTDNTNPEIEQPPVIIDPKPTIPTDNTNPELVIDQHKQLLGSSLQNIAEIIDLQSVSSNQTVQATFSVQRSAGYDNHVSFYKIEDAQGTIISQTGAIFKPGNTGYLAAAIQNRLTNVDLLGVNGQTVVSRSNVQGGAIYAPLLISNDKPDSVNLNFSNVYTAYSAANADKTEHIRLLGNNTFGFEDVKAGGGDRDFNDLVVNLKVKSS